MPERKAKVSLPMGEVEGTELQVEQSNERWSEFTLSDGTQVRAKLSIASAIRVDGQYDELGNPIYAINSSPIFYIVNVPEQYRKKAE